MRRTILEASLTIGGQLWAVGISDPIDISIELDPHSERQPDAFFLPRANAVAVEVGAFLGDTRRGGSCNCEVVTLYPHGNGTHTECIGHVIHDRVSVHGVLGSALFAATLLTVRPEPIGQSGDTYPCRHDPGEHAVSRAAIERALGAMGGATRGFLDALVLRTEPNDVAKRYRSYSGACPPYLTQEAMDFIANATQAIYAQSWTPEVQKLFAGQQTPEGVLSKVQSDYERQVKRGG